MIRKTSLVLLGAAAGVAITLAATQPRLALLGASAKAAAADTYRQLNLFGDVFERVRADYVEKPDDAKLVEQAINGMLNGLDPHSSYMDPKSFRDMQVQTRGEFGGSGSVTIEDCLVRSSRRSHTPAATARRRSVPSPTSTRAVHVSAEPGVEDARAGQPYPAQICAGHTKRSKFRSRATSFACVGSHAPRRDDVGSCSSPSTADFRGRERRSSYIAQGATTIARVWSTWQHRAASWTKRFPCRASWTREIVSRGPTPKDPALFGALGDSPKSASSAIKAARPRLRIVPRTAYHSSAVLGTAHVGRDRCKHHPARHTRRVAAYHGALLHAWAAIQAQGIVRNRGAPGVRTSEGPLRQQGESSLRGHLRRRKRRADRLAPTPPRQNDRRQLAAGAAARYKTNPPRSPRLRRVRRSRLYRCEYRCGRRAPRSFRARHWERDDAQRLHASCTYFWQTAIAGVRSHHLGSLRASQASLRRFFCLGHTVSDALRS